MKKIFLVIIVVIGFCVSIKAQQFTNFYSNSNITAQIRKLGYRSNNCGVDEKHLFIKNKTNRTIKVTGILKVEFRQCAGDYKSWERQQNFDITIYANSESRVGYYYHPESKIGYNNTLGFWIDEIDGISTASNSNQGTAQNNSVPSWLIGTYGDDSAVLFTINSNQIQWWDGAVGDFVTIDGGSVFFLWRNGTGTCKITKASQNRVLYQNSTTGASYIVTKR